MKYLIASNVAIDKIYLADGSSTEYLPGGAGLHALTGIQLWTDDVQIACGVGADWKDKIGSWIEKNNINTSAFDVRDSLTPLNSCTYLANGDRIDKTVYGDEHYLSLDCKAKDLRRYFENNTVDAVYTFRDDEEDFWNTLIEYKKKYGFAIEWEINAGICIPSKLNRIKEILTHCEVFSLNKKEAFSLFDVNTEDEAIACLQSLGLKMILFRTGAKGLYVLFKGEVQFFPSIEKDQSKVLDVTGCGNSSSAASLWAWLEGFDINGIGYISNITSSYCLKQYSVMDIGEEKRTAAYNLLHDLSTRNRTKGE